MVPVKGLSHLSNPLITSELLETSASQIDGVSLELQQSIIYESSRLIQKAGILLRLPQDVIAASSIIFTRFWQGSTGGSLLHIDAKVRDIP